MEQLQPDKSDPATVRASRLWRREQEIRWRRKAALSRTLFSWEAQAHNHIDFPSACPWCDAPTQYYDYAFSSETTTDLLIRCPLCGWQYKKYIWYSEYRGVFEGTYTWSLLKEFKNQVTESSLQELRESPGAAWPCLARQIADTFRAQG